MKVLNVDIKNKKEISVFFFGDLHRGSALSDTKSIIRDLDEARRRGSRILCVGDIFDAIIPQDPRYTPPMLEKSLWGCSDMIDEIIRQTAELFRPYADLIDVLGDGNHEWQLNKRHHTNMTLRLCERLNTQTGSHIKYGGYFYYLVYRFYYGKQQHGVKSRCIVLVHHGLGTSAPVTKGMIDIARYRDAGFRYDILAFGHKHKSFALREAYCEPVIGHFKNRLAIHYTKSFQTGSYVHTMDVSDSETDGYIAPWEETKAFGPAITGGVFTTIKIVQKKDRGKRLFYEPKIVAEI